MPKIIHPLAEAFFHSDLIASRLSLFIAELCWAVMLWWPGDTFARPTYSGMAWLMPEWLWGMVFAASSLCQLAVIISQAYATPFGRCFAAFNGLLWLYCVMSMLWSVYPPPAAVGGEIALMLAAIWIWARPAIIEKGERLAAQ